MTTTRRGRSMGMWAGLASALCALSVSGGAFAEPGSGVDLDQVVAALDSESFRTREAATVALAGDLSIPEEEIASILDRTDLSAEQSWRVQDALRRRFESTARGAIGIRYNQGTNPPRIAEVFPEFPAKRAGLIHWGDEIVSVEGRVLEGDISVMPEETFSRDPGDVLHLHIRRTDRVDENGNVIPIPEAEQNPNGPFLMPGSPGTVTREFDIEVELGSTGGFPDQMSVTSGLLDRALAARLRRMGIRSAESMRIEPEVDAEAWNEETIAVPSPMEHWSRVISGPVEVGMQVRNPGAVAVAQRNAALVRQLNQLRAGNDKDLPAALNVRAARPNARQAEILRQIPAPRQVRAQADLQARMRQQELEAQRKRAALRQRAQALEEIAPTVTMDKLGEANRLAMRIGELEGRIDERVRMMQGTGADDASVRRLAEAQIEALRLRVDELRARLLDVMEGNPATEIEASLEGE